MKIMFFCAGGDIGGAKTHILSLAKALSKDNEIKLVSLRNEGMYKEALSLGIDAVAIDVKEGIVAAFKFAIKQANLFKPDLIHCHGAKANIIACVLKKKLGIPLMTTVHSNPKLDYMGSTVKRLTIGTSNIIAIKHMDYWVAVSDSMKKVLIEMGIDPQRIFPIYNGFDFTDSEKIKREKNTKDIITVGIAARLDPVKDIPTLIRGFAIAYKENPKLRLSIAGMGDEKHNLITLTKELGIDSVTRFEGWIDDIKSYFSTIDINVLSSISETFPYSLLEGAYEHCPVIATNVGGIPSLVKHGLTGYLFEPKDVQTLARYIVKLSLDENLRNQLANNLYKRGVQNYSLDSMRDCQNQVYSTILRREKIGSLKGAVLCGAYGKGNAGDEAILSAILSQLKEIDPDMNFWVTSRNPMETRKNVGVKSFYIFDVVAFIRALKKSVLFVNGGGSLIQDVTSSRSLYFYLFTLKLAKLLNCKVIMYGCGIGPLIKEKHKAIAGKVLNSTADIITLRDSGSKNLLKEMNVMKPEIIQAADPTVNLPRLTENEILACFEDDGIPQETKMLGLCLRSWDTFKDWKELAKAADYAYEKYGLTPVFVPIEYPSDLEISEEIGKLLSAPYYISSTQKNSFQTIGMLSQMDLVLGMRLHSLIFATAGNTPVIGLSYDVKVDSFIKDIDSKACVSAAKFSAEELMFFMDEIMQNKQEISQKCNKLKTLEKENIKAARKLLGA